MSTTMVAVTRERMSLLHEGFQEADRHKWIESEKQGCDLGMQAVLDWYQTHWLHYCRHHRIEHVVGRRECEEFEDQPSQFILQLLQSNDLLVDRILDRLLCGWENLDIIIWGREWGISTKRIIEILEQLDINSARIDPPISISD